MNPSRFNVLRHIASGGEGRVFHAFDTDLSIEVAIKTVDSLDQEGVFRLKSEFRALRKLHQHPKLVSILELHVVHEQGLFGSAFYTMQYVDGMDFVSFHRQLPASERTRGVRASALQLAEAVCHLHQNGCTHGDIKPQNVMLNRMGELTLMDFGMSRLTAESFRSSTDFQGTLRYASPEQLTGTGSKNADWYAFGVLLYESMVGAIPWGDAPKEILAKKLELRPKVPEEIELEPAFRELIEDLISPDADSRPTVEKILTVLNLQDTPAFRSEKVNPRLYPDRNESLATLLEALGPNKPRLALVEIEGEPGIGKSTFVQKFANLVEECTHFYTACDIREKVAFKSLDPLVDHLVRRHASDFDRVSFSDSEIRTLTGVFPAFGRLERAKDVQKNQNRVRDVANAKHVALGLLARFVGVVASSERLLFIVDDAQWADNDSRTFFKALLQMQLCTIVLAYRPEELSGDCLVLDIRAQVAEHERVRLSLQRLSMTATVAVVASNTRRQEADPFVTALAKASVGLPFLIDEYCRKAALGPSVLEHDENYSVRVLELVTQGLSPREKIALQIVYLVRGPIEESLLLTLIGESALAMLGVLRFKTLIVPKSKNGSVYYDAPHALHRDSILERLSALRLKRLSRVLLHAFRRSQSKEPADFIELNLLAERPEEAAHAALAAGVTAYRNFGFSLATTFFSRCATASSDAVRLRALRLSAKSLSSAGRGGESSAAYVAASELASSLGSNSAYCLELRRLAAEQSLRSGHVETGLALLREVLMAHSEPYPDGKASAMLLLAASFALRKLPKSILLLSSDPNTQRRKADVCWSAASGLVWLDTLSSAAFQMRHAALADTANDPIHSIRASATDAVFAAVRGGNHNRRRAIGYLRHAKQLAEHQQDPLAQGLAKVCAAGTHYFSGNFEIAESSSKDAEEFLRARCSGATWEITNVNIFYAWSLAHTGQTSVLSHELPRMLSNADDLGDRLRFVSLTCGLPNAIHLLALDQPDRLIRSVDSALESWSSDQYYSPHYYGLVSKVLGLAYQGEYLAAAEMINAHWDRLQKSGLLRFQLIRCELLYLRGKVNVAAYATVERRSVAQKFQRVAEQSLNGLSREKFPVAYAWHDSLAASKLCVEGSHKPAVSHYESAALKFAKVGMNLHEQASNHCKGLLDGDRSGYPLKAADQRLLAIIYPETLERL